MAKKKASKKTSGSGDAPKAKAKGTMYRATLKKAASYSDGRRKYFKGTPQLVDEKTAEGLRRSGHFMVEAVSPSKKEESAD